MAGSATGTGPSLPGKKILWVDSSHSCYEWSTGIEQGIRRQSQDSGNELRIVPRDGKRSFSDFTEALLLAQNEVDIRFMHHYAAIEDWDPVAAERSIVDPIKVHTGGFVSYMSPFVFVALVKEANEQGEWAADTALKILGGLSCCDPQSRDGCWASNLRH